MSRAFTPVRADASRSSCARASVEGFDSRQRRRMCRSWLEGTRLRLSSLAVRVVSRGGGVGSEESDIGGEGGGEEEVGQSPCNGTSNRTALSDRV